MFLPGSPSLLAQSQSLICDVPHWLEYSTANSSDGLISLKNSIDVPVLLRKHERGVVVLVAQALVDPATHEEPHHLLLKPFPAPLYISSF